METTVAKLGVDSATTWFVGDNSKADIVGANAAGLFSVWYNPDAIENGGIEPGATLRSRDEFEKLVNPGVSQATLIL